MKISPALVCHWFSVLDGITVLVRSMPTGHSKLAIKATCREYAHPWTESCVNATAGLGLHALQESLRIYSTVYVITLLMSGKIPRSDDIKRTILGILQSTAFLSFSGFAYSMFICLLRRLLGYFNIATVSFLPSFLSSLLAILIERPSRRPLLCLYVSNIATETLFRMGVWRRYFPVIPNGQVCIFAVSIAMLLHFYRSKKTYHDSIYNIIRFLIGPHEEFNYFVKQNSSPTKLSNESSGLRKNRSFSDSTDAQNPSSKAAQNAFNVYRRIVATIKMQAKHVSCPHPHSCAYYIFSGTGRLFTIGLCGQLALKVILQAKRLIKNPTQLKSAIFKQGNLNFALFIGGFTGIYRFVSCALRRSFGRDSQNFAIPAGLLASVAFLAFPDNTIALYFMWKALQILWSKGVEDGRLPQVKWFVILLYCFSTAVLFHVAIMEPQNLRASYWKFLCQVSGGRIATMSRTPLDQFGLNTTANMRLVLKKTNTTDKNIYSF